MDLSLLTVEVVAPLLKCSNEIIVSRGPLFMSSVGAVVASVALLMGSVAKVPAAALLMGSVAM